MIAMAAMGVARVDAPQAYVWVRLLFTFLLLAWLFRPVRRPEACIPELTQQRAHDTVREPVQEVDALASRDSACRLSDVPPSRESTGRVMISV
mmetsp:Transcript_47215/g.107108  ORF Transcript_47215/g.107108 Transcript_47215/m.107108 type:complete len:93 (+) Transcript_47215:3-281(+)